MTPSALPGDMSTAELKVGSKVVMHASTSSSWEVGTSIASLKGTLGSWEPFGATKARLVWHHQNKLMLALVNIALVQTSFWCPLT